MSTENIKTFTENLWAESILEQMKSYIEIPCKSPAFDADWQNTGHIETAVCQMVDWVNAHPAKDMNAEIIRLPNRTPLIFIDIPGSTDETVLLYGHMDKQPEMTGWEEGLEPWKAVLRGDKLYGRGGADDGYALYASLTAILALQDNKLPHARCVIIIEASEESGSSDLPAYIEHLEDRIGQPNLIICLDSGAGNYKQMWSTTSLRGILGGTLSVDILTEGMHSGAASGAVADSFRIARQLISRVEDEKTGKILVDECHVDIPTQRIEQANAAADILGNGILKSFPLIEGAKTTQDSPADILLQKTWHPTLTVVGADGIPSIENGGNVLRPSTKLKLSFRLPPSGNVNTAGAAIKKALEADPPYNAKVSFTIEDVGSGWSAPELAPWLEKAANKASNNYFGKDTGYIGEGGSIPFMGMLGEKFPKAQFLITGVLGPKSNAHGPNEFLHIPMAKKLTCCVADVLVSHYEEFSNR